MSKYSKINFRKAPHKIMKYREHEIKFFSDKSIKTKIRTTSHKKEPDTVEWLESHHQDDMVLYDIGANTGPYSLIASKLGYKTFAFEPSFPSFYHLCVNISINDADQNTVPFQVALSDETGLNTFNYSSLVPGTAEHAFGKAINDEGNEFTPVYTQKIIGYSLDDFVNTFGLELPNIIKIDVDGIEKRILEGAKNILKSPRMKSVLIETHDNRITDILRFLHPFGYKLVNKREKTVPGVSNFIFTRPE